MNSSRLRRYALCGVALFALAATGCSSAPSELSNGASAADPDAAETTLLTPVEAAPVDGLPSDTSAPSAESADAADEASDVVVEAQDGAASEPVTEDPVQEVAVQGPDTAEVCAIVEFGYLGLLNGEVGVEIDDRLAQGAQAALVLDDERYVQSGEALLDAVGSPDAGDRADALLAFCADDGFERLG